LAEEKDFSGQIENLKGNIKERQARIFKSGIFVVPLGILFLLVLHFYLISAPVGLESLELKLIFIFKWLFIALIPYVLVCMTIMTNRFNEGAHNPMVGGESFSLKVHCRMMQNTLEQYVILASCLLPLGLMLPANHLQLIPIASIWFLIARMVYWKGYLNQENVTARAPGVQLTAIINFGLFFLALALISFDIFPFLK